MLVNGLSSIMRSSFLLKGSKLSSKQHHLLTTLISKNFNQKRFNHSNSNNNEINLIEKQNNIIQMMVEKKLMNGLNNELGVKLLKLNMIPNKQDNLFIQMSMTITKQHLNAIGLVHGGSLSTLIDTAIGTGAFIYANQFLQGKGMVVLDSFTQFIKKASINDELIVIAKPSHLGKTTQIWEATIYLGDPSLNIKIAQSKSTILNTDNNKIENKEEENKNVNKLGRNFNINKMSKEEIANRFDKYSEQWEFLTTISDYQKNVISWIIKELKQYSNNNILLESNLKVLDLATGSGLVGRSIDNVLKQKVKDFEMIGLDISKGMIQKAKELNIYHNLFVHDLDNFITCLNENESFDFITCFGVTEMLKDINNVLLPEIKRLLKKDDKSQCWISFQFNNGTNSAIHQGMRNYSLEQIQDMLKRNNLKLLEYTILDNAYLLPSTSGEIQPVPFCIVKCCHQM
ncbi:hypothetical protein ABK040_004433 [Willaertia magna]